MAHRAAPPALAALACVHGLQTLRNFSGDDRTPALYGIYVVDSFEADGQAVPPLATDPIRWRRVVINRWGTVVVQHMDETEDWFSLDDDSSRHVAILTSRRDRAVSFELAYARGAADALTLDGEWRGAKVHVVSHRIDDATFLLVNRGFHWISEYPYNR